MTLAGNDVALLTLLATPWRSRPSHCAPFIGGRFSSRPACSGSGGSVRLSDVQIALSRVSFWLSNQRLLKWLLLPALPVRSKLRRLPSTFTFTGNALPAGLSSGGGRRLAISVKSPSILTLYFAPALCGISMSTLPFQPTLPLTASLSCCGMTPVFAGCQLPFRLTAT